MISICFTRPKSKWAVLSYLIRWVCNSEYSHVSLKYDSTWLDRSVYFEARGLNTHFTSAKDFESQESVLHEYEIVCSAEFEKKALQFCFDNTNVGYAVIDLFVLPIVILAKRLGFKKFKNFVAYGASKEICSKLIAFLIAVVFLEDVTDDLETVTPPDVLNFCEAWKLAKRLK